MDNYILTPKAKETPRINGARVFGVRPGSPFLYAIPATGKKPIEFTVDGLPEGLKVNPQTGLIVGAIADAGEYKVTLKAKNELGEDSREFTIKVGEKICLTPPLGWNSWNCWGLTVDDKKVRDTAEALVDVGLAEHGWSYINIDDGWQGERAGKNTPLAANEKFPDMKDLCDYIHSLGLKVGTYSTPWTGSYGKYPGGSSDNEDGTWEYELAKAPNEVHNVGKYRFDDADAKQWAEWGMDYLKYDWNPNDEDSIRSMSEALKNSGRDIAFSLSNSAPYHLADVNVECTNAWRTTGDISDVWFSDHANKPATYMGIVDILRGHRKWQSYCGPGHYPDPDMLVVGEVGFGDPKPSRLSADEQYSHISMWSLWSAPLLIGCPVERMDEFTIALLSNDEVLDVQQDSLCHMAISVNSDNDYEVMVKNLEDGSKAVGFFNLSKKEAEVGAKWFDLDVRGKQGVRDLWRQEDIGEFEGEIRLKVPSHGVVMVRMWNK